MMPLSVNRRDGNGCAGSVGGGSESEFPQRAESGGRGAADGGGGNTRARGRLLIDVPGVDGIAGHGHRRGATQPQKSDAVAAGFSLYGATAIGAGHRSEHPRDVRGGCTRGRGGTGG